MLKRRPRRSGFCVLLLVHAGQTQQAPRSWLWQCPRGLPVQVCPVSASREQLSWCLALRLGDTHCRLLRACQQVGCCQQSGGAWGQEEMCHQAFSCLLPLCSLESPSLITWRDSPPCCVLYCFTSTCSVQLFSPPGICIQIKIKKSGQK